MGAELALNTPLNLKLYQPPKYVCGELVQLARTPNAWFCERYPAAYQRHGSPFMELTQPVDQFTNIIFPVTINTDFMACVLGGRRDLGHNIIYLEPELAWYYRESDGIYRITTSDKLTVLYRALLMKCAQDMPANVHKLNLVNEFRSDKVCKAIIQRAKSILAADHTFFSATSANQRVKGPELFERLMRVLCNTMLQPNADAYLTVTQAYAIFCNLTQQRSLGPMKRSMFKATMADLMREAYGVSLRRDVADESGKHQEAWKGVGLIESETLAA